MKKLLKNKLLVAGLAVLILSGGAFVIVKGIQNKNKASENKEETVKEAEIAGGKTDTPPDTDAQTPTQAPTPSPTPTPVTNTNLGSINDVSLTVYVNAQATTSLDGKTTIPAGSISPYFYLASGVYTVQKLSGQTWVDVATNINYPGHGGLAVQTAGPAEDNVNYRVLRLENGTAKDVSKTFIVKRAELAAGVKTYN